MSNQHIVARTASAYKRADSRATRRESIPPSVRFLKAIKVDEDGCWRWQRSLARSGYGQFNLDRKTVPAHRAAYEMFVGPIPEGLVLDHLCRDRSCVNPKHLEPVTVFENSRRAGLRTGAIHKAKTHCPKGHPYDAENTIVRKEGGRSCRACVRERARQKAIAERATNPPAPRWSKSGYKIHAVFVIYGSATLREIEAHTGFQYATVTRIVKMFVRAGVVVPCGKQEASSRDGRGPPAQVYMLVGDRSLFAAHDASVNGGAA